MDLAGSLNSLPCLQLVKVRSFVQYTNAYNKFHKSYLVGLEK